MLMFSTYKIAKCVQVSQNGLKMLTKNIEKDLLMSKHKLRTVYSHRETKIELKKSQIVKQVDNPKKSHNMFKRVVDPIFHGNPKTREEMWHENFLKDKFMVDQSSSLIKLVYNITLSYLDDCTPIILYDNQIKTVDSYLFQNLFKNFPVSFIHGYIDEGNNLNEPKLLSPEKDCLHFILFLNEVKKSVKVLGKQSQSKVVVIARSSQWAIQEFLALPISRSYVNLLIIGQSFKDENNAVRNLKRI